ncbi:TniQ family protein [Xylophilus ampelinus]|nr:TniQ family protein [Xylophilus ampelinus]
MPDELLSSWMIRLARGNGFKVHNFCAQFFGRDRQIWNRDIDHHAPPWLLDALAARSGTTPERIVQTTLRAFESFAFERFNEVGVTRWILPLGVFHRTRRAYGQQFCPLCLANDPEPYLRRSWRLALVVICTRHGVLLQDRCPECESPMTPHRSDMAARSGVPERTNMMRCYKCRSRVDAAVRDAAPEDIQMQMQIDAVLRDGFIVMESGRDVYAPLYFDGLRMIMRVAELPPTVRHRSGFEFTSIEHRLKLLRAAVELTGDWPTRLLRRCSTLSHAYTSVSGQEQGPYWLDSVLRWEVLNRRALLSQVEAESIAAAARRLDAFAPLGGLTRRLSGRDIAHLLPALPPVTNDSADMLIASLDQEISVASTRRRLLLLRDKVMFIAARCLCLSVPQILALSVDDLNSIGGEEFSFWERIDTRDRAWAMLRWYSRNVRPLLASVSTKALFTTVEGGPLKRNAVGMRFVRAVSAAGLARAIPDWTRWVRGS